MLRKLLYILTLTSFVAFAQSGFFYGDSILAVVGEKVITAFEVMQAAARDEAHLLRNLAPAEREEKIIALRRKVLDNMIDHELVYLEFLALKAKVPETAIHERLNHAVISQAGGDMAKFEEMLYREQMTLQEFREKLSKNIAVDMLLYDRVNRGITISPMQIENYFQENCHDFQEKASYRIEVILLRKDGRYSAKLSETIAEIKQKLAQDEVFSELAKIYSEGANAENGGDQGFLTDMNEKLFAVVKTLETGECSKETLELGNSIYFVKLLEHKEANNKLNAELREKIRNILLEKEEEVRYEKFLRTLRLKYPFKRMDGVNF